MMTLVYGGSSCGKSAFAESLILKNTSAKRFYIATMIAWDEECRERIKRHRKMRKEKQFTTLECPVDAGKAEFPAGSAILLECVSNLAANEMYRTDMERPKDKASERIISGIEALKSRAGDLVIVTNDVSGDGEAYAEETEAYRKLLGDINIRLARMADTVYEVTCGIPALLKGVAGSGDLKEQAEKTYAAKELTADGKDIHMRLLVGGAHQGKAKAAEELAADMEKPELILNIHETIRNFCVGERTEQQAEEKLYGFLEELIKEHPHAVITCDELGCGIVPMKKEDRLWREMTGDACQYLAARAEMAYRVVCGIPVQIKGREANGGSE